MKLKLLVALFLFPVACQAQSVFGNSLDGEKPSSTKSIAAESTTIKRGEDFVVSRGEDKSIKIYDLESLEGSIWVCNKPDGGTFEIKNGKMVSTFQSTTYFDIVLNGGWITFNEVFRGDNHGAKFFVNNSGLLIRSDNKEYRILIDTNNENYKSFIDRKRLADKEIEAVKEKGMIQITRTLSLMKEKHKNDSFILMEIRDIEEGVIKQKIVLNRYIVPEFIEEKKKRDFVQLQKLFEKQKKDVEKAFVAVNRLAMRDYEAIKRKLVEEGKMEESQVIQYYINNLVYQIRK